MRLTYKYENENGYGSVKLKNLPLDPLVDKLSYLDNVWEEQRNKLGQLEDIEDEFGIDFIFINEICKNGVYCYKRIIKDFNGNGKRLGNIIHIPNFDIHIQFFGCYKKERMGVSIMGCIDYVYHSLPLNEYGKTWALTKEELL